MILCFLIKHCYPFGDVVGVRETGGTNPFWWGNWLRQRLLVPQALLYILISIRKFCMRLQYKVNPLSGRSTTTFRPSIPITSSHVCCARLVCLLI
jgi:hypothetical protein